MKQYHTTPRRDRTVPTALALTAALFVAAPAVGASQAFDLQVGQRADVQEHEAGAEHQDMAQRYMLIETLQGTTVRLSASGEERREAAEDGERPDRPECTLDDFLIEPSTGRITRALIGVGGFLGIGEKEVAIDFSQLSWNQEEECFDLSMTEQQLEDAPDFDYDEEVERDRKARATEASAGMDDEARRMGDKTFHAFAGSFFAGGNVDELELYGQDGEEFGGVGDAIVDRADGRVAYLVVSRGGVAGIGDEKYLIPFSAVKMKHVVEDEGDDPTPALWIDHSIAQLEALPKYEEPEDGVLSMEQKKALDERFGKDAGEKMGDGRR